MQGTELSLHHAAADAMIDLAQAEVAIGAVWTLPRCRAQWNVEEENQPLCRRKRIGFGGAEELASNVEVCTIGGLWLCRWQDRCSRGLQLFRPRNGRRIE